MRNRLWISVMGVACLFMVAVTTADDAPASFSISGKILNPSGEAQGGAMVSAFDEVHNKSISVFTSEDGTFEIADLALRDHQLRVRLLGFGDEWQDIDADSGGVTGIEVKLTALEGVDLQLQRPAVDRLSLLSWDTDELRMNFKMSCTYCHQIGTDGFRTPEEPVDWEILVTRMDGFAALHQQTKDELVEKLAAVYGLDKELEWPEYTPPAPPSGKATQVIITEWPIGKSNGQMSLTHDLELGDNGMVYVVDQVNDAIEVLNTLTGERETISFPGGKDPSTPDAPILGPHSIERAPDGKFWMTLALGGKMGSFDPVTKEIKVYPGGENGRNIFYPHTLRFDKDGLCWYTSVATNSVLSINTETQVVKRYPLLKPSEGVSHAGGAARGEAGAIVPYGIDTAPDGRIWFTKLNGQRVGVLDPKTGEIKEIEPPVYGPRRLHVAPDGIVWVPGYGSGDFASYNPDTDEWKVYPLPKSDTEIPYALNIHPQTGDVWICGTGSDSVFRFIPETEEIIQYLFPTRVTYTREIEFDDEGNVWLCNASYPARHIENGQGSVIKITVLDEVYNDLRIGG